MKRRLLAPFFGGLIAIVCAEPIPVPAHAAVPVETVARVEASAPAVDGVRERCSIPRTESQHRTPRGPARNGCVVCKSL